MAGSPLTVVILVAAFAMVGCTHTGPAPVTLPDEVRGLFEVGHEAYDFRPCTPVDAIVRPVRPDSGVSLAPRGKGGRGAYNSYVYFVRLRGAVDTLAARDATRSRSRAFLVHEVLEIRAPHRGECGWVPGHGVAG